MRIGTDAVGVFLEVLALQFERPGDPHRLGTGHADVVHIGDGAAVDQANRGQVRVGACAQAQGVVVGVVGQVAQAEVQHIASLVDWRPGATRAIAVAVRLVTGQLAAECTGGHAPIVVAHAIGHAQPARDAIGVRHRRLRHEVVVLGAGQFFQAVGLLELADLQVVVRVAAKLVLDVVIQEAAGAANGGATDGDFLQHARVIAGDPFEVARALALEDQLGAPDAEFGIVAIGTDRTIEVLHIVVEPVAVGLDQAFQRDFRTADYIDGDLGMCCRSGQCQQQRGTKQGGSEFHRCLAT